MRSSAGVVFPSGVTAILDPELTAGLPPKLTAATAMDALTHAIESYTSIQSNPISEALAAKAIPLIRKNILRAVLHGEDIEARGALLTAATIAGVAFDHAMVGVVHGMAHATGGLVGIHHGTANSIFLPWGMEYNLEVCTEKYAEIAARLGEFGIIDNNFAQDKLVKMAKYRNRLAHFYAEIENKELYDIIKNHLEDFEIFLSAVKKVLEHPENFNLSVE